MYVDFVTEYMFTTQSPEEPSLFFTGQASEETRAVARESRGPILESAGHIAIATAGITFMGMTAFAMPYAFLAYAGFASIYTVGRDHLDHIGAPSWLKAGVDAVGILTGSAFVREDLRTIFDPNTSMNRRLSTIGSLGFNLGFGGAQVSGLRNAWKSKQIARSIRGASSIDEVENILHGYAQRITGLDNVTVTIDDTARHLYRPLGTREIIIPSRFVNQRGLAGRFLHETQHIAQEFRNGRSATTQLLRWSASVMPESGMPLSHIPYFIINSVPGYVFNPVEVAAQVAGFRSYSLNFLPSVVLRLTQSLAPPRGLSCQINRDLPCRG